MKKKEEKEMKIKGRYEFLYRNIVGLIGICFTIAFTGIVLSVSARTFWFSCVCSGCMDDSVFRFFEFTYFLGAIFIAISVIFAFFLINAFISILPKWFCIILIIFLFLLIILVIVGWLS